MRHAFLLRSFYTIHLKWTFIRVLLHMHRCSTFCHICWTHRHGLQHCIKMIKLTTTEIIYVILYFWMMMMSTTAISFKVACMFLNYGIYCIYYSLLLSLLVCYLMYISNSSTPLSSPVMLVHHLTQMKVQLGKGRGKHKHSWRWCGIDPAAIN